MGKLRGSMDTLSSMQLTENMEGLDAQSKLILHSKEVLAIILQEVISEYRGYSREEIMDFIHEDSLADEREVSINRTNTQVYGNNAEFAQLNEKVSYFDLVFRAKNPQLTTTQVSVSLHVDIEPQKTYHPGYPVEKRGMYYLARRLSSQLSLITENTDYGQLEKCYSIWICRDDVPKTARYSISTYEMSNTRNTGKHVVAKEKYDLMTLVVIKLGDKVYNGKEDQEGYGLLRFLNAVMYPHKSDFMQTVSEYIDFSGNKELWEEVKRMGGLGQSVLEEGIEQGIEKGIEQGEEFLAALMSRLLQEGRVADAELAAKDSDIRKAFYKEYGILDTK